MRTADHATASCDYFITIGGELATPDAEVVLIIPPLITCGVTESYGVLVG